MDCYYPHYFFSSFDTGEDFYQSTAPSEDIWKKFELLPSPPVSPTRTLGGGGGGALPLSPGDKLSRLSRVLGQDEEYEGQFIPHTPKLFGNLSSNIIRDCMWSSFSASKQLEKVSGRAAAAVAAAPAGVSAARPAKAQCVAAPAADCVDPAAVLAIPTNSCRKAASSGSESRSDSSDDDEDDDDEEEIDVVTVESQQNRTRLVNVRKPVTVTVRADPCPKRFHASVHRQQHNYAAPSPDSDEEEEEDEEEDDEEEEEEEEEQEPPIKRINRKALASPSETPQTSDTEDTDRRKNHNFLERKRRNDLRSRFLALRDQIPGLESSKTPKVAILTHATEYLTELMVKEKRQLQEKKRLKVRQQRLQRRLSELKQRHLSSTLASLLTLRSIFCAPKSVNFDYAAGQRPYGSESRSDSSDDDEDDDDEEEIDVVTVESQQNRTRLVNVRKPVTVTVRADPCPKRFHASVHRQQHNYAAPSPDSDEEEEEDEEEDDEEEEEEEEEQEPPIKRINRKALASPSETPQTSDTEDTDRRKNHNFLERKRRNDLRSRFLALRDQIPGLESSKTPKVAILTHATEYLTELMVKEKRQLQEKKRLKVRQQRLQRRLSELKQR
ncbi:protein L-Myc-1b-like [Brachionichthys hirsutus]|uniref:protein L-Myc-1b-like n=1 Tax=Brachionichthys hirsutus TaxID=412623 RepID=UPI0036051E82